MHNSTPPQHWTKPIQVNKHAWGNPKQAFLISGESKANNRDCCEDLLGAQDEAVHHVRQTANQVAWMHQVLSIRSSEEQPLAV